ncbi:MULTISPECIES: hypothetical protein [Vibrio]|uniref:hypothetical protein n=1 Tax=Vibrio TaxID=662 RepID=UPI000D348286|nr:MULTISPECIES: hypothetical protein [Vibrio]MCZ4307703.1 hypothetical protein [Vibrio atlanticus]PTP32246.1 hypothetical protein CWN92_03480 [Vibrio splendidus]PTP61337.1 hypothetical protein CWO01_13960 [Vibrio splendidus]
MKTPTVFLDTNIIKFSASELEKLVPHEKVISWGGIKHTLTVHETQMVNPNESIKNNDLLKSETYLLEDVAKQDAAGTLRFVTHDEVQFESWNMPNLNSKRGMFYGANVGTVNSPINYSRTIAGGNSTVKDLQFNFISQIKNARFIEFQKIAGAYQGKDKLPSKNQALDAFHLWCADASHCDYFLTLDLSLIQLVNKRGKDKMSVKVVTPSELLSLIAS